MNGVVAELLTQAQAYSAAEIVAVLLAVLYLLLAIRQNIACWPCAAASTAIFAWLFFDARLYMEALLNVFYFAMAFYGWYCWSRGARARDSLPVVRWALRPHLVAVSVIVGCSLLTGYLLVQRTDAAFPYVDSLTSYAAIWATFLVARKVLENWWYWLLIDATMTYVFWAKGLEFTAALYVVYLLMIPFGLISWTRSWRESPA